MANANRNFASEIRLHRDSLSRFVRIQAEATAELLNFRWQAVAEAPSTYLALQVAYAESWRTGRPLPVSDAHCADTIYDEPNTNHAKRFWHDVTHVRLGADVSKDSELRVANAQLQVLEAAGWDRQSPVYRLLEGDTVGQTLCSALLNSFPVNQKLFVIDCLRYGINEAVVKESKRITIKCHAPVG